MEIKNLNDIDEDPKYLEIKKEAMKKIDEITSQLEQENAKVIAYQNAKIDELNRRLEKENRNSVVILILVFILIIATFVLKLFI